MIDAFYPILIPFLVLGITIASGLWFASSRRVVVAWGKHGWRVCMKREVLVFQGPPMPPELSPIQLVYSGEKDIDYYLDMSEEEFSWLGINHTPAVIVALMLEVKKIRESIS